MDLKTVCQKTGWGKRKQEGASRGFTLIEVLLALFILSVGMLGLAVLQNRALKDNHSALLRSVAVQHAEDILDRIRANRANVANYAIALDVPNAWDLENPNRATLGTGLTASGYGGMAHTDLLEWKFGLAQNLTLGNGSIAVAGNRVTVTIQWSEGNNNVTVITNAQP